MNQCSTLIDGDRLRDCGPFKSAAERVREDEWRKMKDRFFNEKSRRDAAREAKRTK